MEQKKQNGIIEHLLDIAEKFENGLNLLENALHYRRQVATAETEGCNGVPMPTQPPQGHTLGHYYCTKTGWQWEDEIG